jgi:adenosylmethionine-8-amino-7-oxononanoate aminotransferase
LIIVFALSLTPNNKEAGMATSHVFPRHTKTHLPVAVGGEGPYLIDENGKRYFDACGGAAVSCLGHNHPAIQEAMREQIGKLSYAHTSFFTSKPAEELAALLADKAPGSLSRVYFVSGGSEAMEAAIKLARQYFLEQGEPQRCHFIARRQSYHGNTLGALSAGGNMWRREPFEPLMVPVMHHVSPCHAWRWKEEGETDEAYGDRLAQELDKKINEIGPDKVAAFLAEPVVGASMGAVPPVKHYFKKIKKICDQYGVLLILDEVMCGMGRTGTLFACEQDDIQPDMIAIAKGLGAGYQPIGALMVHDKIYQAIEEGSGFFQHGHTYIGHPLACAAGLAVMETFEQEQLLGNVRRQGDILKALLENTFQSYDEVGDIRGRGLFIGLELVKDKAAKQAYDPSFNLAGKIKKAAMARGLMVYPMGGTIDGRNGDHILLAPPFIMTDSDAGLITERLKMTLDDVLRDG